MCLYVDDGLLFCQEKSVVSEILNDLQTHFHVKICSPTCFVKMKIENCNNYILYIRLDYLRNKFNMTEANTNSVPAAPHVKLTKLDVQEEEISLKKSCEVSHTCCNNKPPWYSSCCQSGESTYTFLWKTSLDLFRENIHKIPKIMECVSYQNITGHHRSSWVQWCRLRQWCFTTGYVFIKNGAGHLIISKSTKTCIVHNRR